MLKKAIKIVVAVFIILTILGFVLLYSTSHRHDRTHTQTRLKSDFHQLSIAIMIYHSDGGMIPTDIGQLYDFAVKEKYLYSLEQLRFLTFKDNLIYDFWGSEIIYYYDVESTTCSFKSFGRNKVDDNGEKDDIVYEYVIDGI